MKSITHMSSSLDRRWGLFRGLFLVPFFGLSLTALSNANVPPTRSSPTEILAKPSTSFADPANVANLSESPVFEGARLSNASEFLKKYYPAMTSLKEIPFLPLNNGGQSFMGLVNRLLGEGIHRDFEGLKTRRYMYHVFENDKMLGLVHGSTALVRNNAINIFVFYSPRGELNNFYIEGLPPEVERILTEGPYLKQFIGKSTEDFELVRGRRGKVRSKGLMLTQSKHPPSAEARNYFEKILRSIRFNAAFLDVAYFITQHPDLAETRVNEFPSEVQVTTEAPTTGPEAFVRNRPANPFATQAIIQPLVPEESPPPTTLGPKE